MNKMVSRISLTVGIVIGMTVMMLSSSVVHADSVSVNFEPPTYTLGSVSGQDGWSNAVNPSIDQAVVTTTVSGFDTQALRESDAYTDGAFGDWLFVKPLTDAVGEPSSTDGTFTPGTLQSHFEMQFDITSASTSYQPGMHLSVSPDRGDGSRMSYLRFEDSPDGINVFFDDVLSSDTPGSDVFNETEIATGLDRTVKHTIKLTMDVVPGPSNDVVNVYIDGVLVHTGTSWEDYYRYDPEASAEQSPRIVKTMIIQSRGTADPANLGGGFLIDNISLLSSTPPPPTVKVTIDKFIDGAQANATTAEGLAFPMETTYSATNIGSGTDVPFTLSSTGFNSPNPYEAVTSDMSVGANYTASEVTGGTVVGASCATDQPYALAGYSAGATFADAESAATTTAAPSFTNMSTDEFVIVHNKPCLAAPVNLSPANGSILTSAQWTLADWTDVTSPVGGVTYLYESSNSSSTNADGSFTSPAYQSGVLATSQIPTPGTPNGTWFWHARAVDADGNMSPWGAATEVTVTNLVQVHILKYLDGAEANASSAARYEFPMVSTWQTANLDGGATSTGNYVLGDNFGGASNLYGADTAPMAAPAYYTTNEVTNDVDATSKVLPPNEECVAGDYQLTGYQVSGISFADAAAQSSTTVVPAFNGIGSDQYVIVDNITCPTTGTLTVTKSAIGGDGTFTFSGDNGLPTSFTITTLSGTGSMTFPNLTPGTYHITEAKPPTGWTETDGTACASVTVTAGGTDSCTIVDTKNVKLGAILGTKFEDRDGDGTLKDGDHHRLAGWTIYIDKNDNGKLDPNESSTVTDKWGNYSFLNLPAGTYIVREVEKTGWKETVPASDEYVVTLAAGQVAKSKNFGNFHLGTISGMKFNDANADSRKDNGETGLANWTIKITGPHGFVETTVTDANGKYSFTDLGPGTYHVTEVQQAGWRQTTSNPGPITIASGSNVKGVNFGNTQKKKYVPPHYKFSGGYWHSY